MVPKGMQNTDTIIEICQDIVTSLGEAADPVLKQTLIDIVNALEELKTMFFLKTMTAYLTS